MQVGRTSSFFPKDSLMLLHLKWSLEFGNNFATTVDGILSCLSLFSLFVSKIGQDNFVIPLQDISVYKIFSQNYSALSCDKNKKCLIKKTKNKNKNKKYWKHRTTKTIIKTRYFAAWQYRDWLVNNWHVHFYCFFYLRVPSSLFLFCCFWVIFLLFWHNHTKTTYCLFFIV